MDLILDIPYVMAKEKCPRAPYNRVALSIIAPFSCTHLDSDPDMLRS